jgi:hypothetical protein
MRERRALTKKGRLAPASPASSPMKHGRVSKIRAARAGHRIKQSASAGGDTAAGQVVVVATVRRLLTLLALLSGLVWGCLTGRALFLPETRDIAKLRTAAGVTAFVLGAIASTGHRRK